MNHYHTPTTAKIVRVTKAFCDLYFYFCSICAILPQHIVCNYAAFFLTAHKIKLLAFIILHVFGFCLFVCVCVCVCVCVRERARLVHLTELFLGDFSESVDV